MGRRKLLIDLAGKPLVSWSIDTLLTIPNLDELVLVVHPQDRGRCGEIVGDLSDRVEIVTGGRERQDSVFEGLKSLGRREGIVIVHDGARPFVTQDLIRSVVERARAGVGAITAIPVRDTVKRIINGKVMETLPRKLVWSIQTPQAFPGEMLFRAYESAMRDGFYSTDDAALCERMGYPVEVVTGNHENIKITTPDDLLYAEWIVHSRRLHVGA